MAKSKVATSPGPDGPRPARVGIANGWNQVQRDLMSCRQTLVCAVEALNKADDDDGLSELGASAIRVVERCAKELVRIEETVDRLSTDKAHSTSAR